MDNRYNKTLYACFTGYIVQAIVNNFAPLLFLTFHRSYGISLGSISALITVNFCMQLGVDLLCAKYIDKIGYRKAMLIAHGAAALGLSGLSFLPDLFSDPFWGLVICVCIYAVGGGILEVVVSPIVEACPTKNKEAAMSLLHSFYCWGHVAVVILSTAFFTLAGIENWRTLAVLWALVPVINGMVFMKVPIATLQAEGEQGLSIKALLQSGLFWITFLMMLCSGACEQGISQWASAFAEKALNIPKSTGDLAGPLSFAVLMGLSRFLYAKCSETLPLERFMLISGGLCVISYLLAALSANPVFSFIGCALCGFSVGIMWPGTFSLASAGIKGGGTAMFALLALAGDFGCSAGPTVVGIVSDLFGGNMKTGILAGLIFPALLIISVLAKRLYEKKHSL